MVYLVGINLIVSLCILAGLAWMFHKVRRIHLASYELRTAVEQVSQRHLADLFRQLQALDSLADRTGIPKAKLPILRGWAASPDFLLVLARHVLEKRPATIVECGSGSSTLILAQCLKLIGRGHIHSIDHDAHFAEQTRMLLEEHGLGEWATIHVAPLTPCADGGPTREWYDPKRIPEVDGIDLLVIDGPPGPNGPLARLPAGPLFIPRLAAGGAIFLDDADRPDEREVVRRWVAAFPDLRKSSLDCEKGCVVFESVAPVQAAAQ